MSPIAKNVLVFGGLEDNEVGEIIIRGRMLKDSVPLLKVDTYQRLAGFSQAKTKKLIQAIEDNKIQNFPDVILGMRGHSFDTVEHNASGNEAIALRDPVYIVDGQQRIFAWVKASEKHPEQVYALGCKVHINTNKKSEAIMFRELNTGHAAMAPSVILRNERENSRVAAMLYGVSHQPSFALCKRVAWDQIMVQGTNCEYVRGAVLLHLLRSIHAHKLQGDGATRGGGNILAKLESTNNQIDNIGLMQARTNLVTFFDVIDEAWGIRNLTGSRPPTHLHWGWLNTLARVLNDHLEFWKDDDTRLYVGNTYISNLRTKLDPSDPDLANLARGTLINRDQLYFLITKRLNRLGLTNRDDVRRKRQKAEDRRDQPEA